MSEDAVEDELLSPPGLGQKLISYGLVPVSITIDEFFLAEHYGDIYKKNQLTIGLHWRLLKQEE